MAPARRPNPATNAQAAAIEALTGPQDSVAEMLSAYAARRDWLIPALNSLPGVTCATPAGAFYAFPNVKGTANAAAGSSSELLTTRLLEKAHVAVTPGDAFGAPGYLRVSYATSLENLQNAVTRIRGVLEGS
jgi:aspartate aminotransferase